VRKWLLAVMAVSATVAAAASTATSKPPIRVAWDANLTVVDKMAGQVSLKVSAGSTKVRIVKATSVPLDASGKVCGAPRAGQLSGASASFKAPYPGANKLVVTATVRATRKIAGKYPQTILVRSALLGGVFYGCAHGSPPAPQVVCDYGTTQPGTINTDAKDCGLPVPDSPFWTSKPTLVGDTVLVPHIGLKTGYCWATLIQHAGPVNWFGGLMNYAVVWNCSDGTSLFPLLRVWLTAPNDLNGRWECNPGISDTGWANYGVPWSFTVPAGLGGRLDVQWSFAVRPPNLPGNQPSVGAEWSSASFYFHGNVDGCQKLMAPAAPAG